MIEEIDIEEEGRGRIGVSKGRLKDQCSGWGLDFDLWTVLWAGNLWKRRCEARKAKEDKMRKDYFRHVGGEGDGVDEACSSRTAGLHTCSGRVCPCPN